MEIYLQRGYYRISCYVSSLGIYFPATVSETDQFTDFFACNVIQATSPQKRDTILNFHQPDNIPDPWQREGAGEGIFSCISKEACGSWKHCGVKSESEKWPPSLLVRGFSSPCSARPHPQRGINSMSNILPDNQGDGGELFLSGTCGGVAPEDTTRLKDEFTPWAPTRSTSVEKFKEHYLILFFSPCQQTFGNGSRNLSQNISYSSISLARLSSFIAPRSAVISPYLGSSYRESGDC